MVEIHVLYSVIFCYFLKSYRLWDNVEKYGEDGQTTYDNVIGHMRIACWATSATNSHTQVVKYSLLFHYRKGHANAPQYYVIRTLTVLFRTLFGALQCCHGSHWCYVPYHVRCEAKSVGEYRSSLSWLPCVFLMLHVSKEKKYLKTERIIQHSRTIWLQFDRGY